MTLTCLKSSLRFGQVKKTPSGMFIESLLSCAELQGMYST